VVITLHAVRHPAASRGGQWTLLAALVLLGLPACGSDPSGAEAVDGGFGEPTTTLGTTVFPQRIATQDGQEELFPGQANHWDLHTDFRLGSGGAGQLVEALALEVTVVDDTQPFPDQSYEDLTWLTPFLGPGDGVTTVDACDGAACAAAPCACIAPTRDSRLGQTLDLSGAQGSIRLLYTLDALSRAEHYDDEPHHFQVVIRDAEGALLESLARCSSAPEPECDTLAPGDHDLTAYAGQVIVLSFEQRGPSNGAFSTLDDVAVCDAGATDCAGDPDRNFATNGDFANGLEGWTANALSTVRNVQSPPVAFTFVGDDGKSVGLRVTRSFYASPGSVWGRMVDVFENPSDEVVQVSTDYSLSLAAAGRTVTYFPIDAGGIALASWDGGLCGIRDVGWAMGITSDIDFRSNDAGLGDGLGGCEPTGGNGWGTLYSRYDFGVPAGESIGIVNYVVLLAEATGVEGVETLGTRAERLETELRRILNGYPEDRSINAYTEGMTQEQLEAIANF